MVSRFGTSVCVSIQTTFAYFNIVYFTILLTLFFESLCRRTIKILLLLCNMHIITSAWCIKYLGFGFVGVFQSFIVMCVGRYDFLPKLS